MSVFLDSFKDRKVTNGGKWNGVMVSAKYVDTVWPQSRICPQGDARTQNKREGYVVLEAI